MNAPVLKTASVDDVVEEARNGRSFLVVENAEASSGGVLAASGQHVTPDHVNFMARFARGLICIAIPSTTARRLNLPLQAGRGRPADIAPFTVSIEARTGVSTGISAGDRARTILVAVDPASGPEDLVSPGHVFPVIARDGGVLARAGHAEAVVDLCRVAELGASAAFCRVLDEDGNVADSACLARMALTHDLKILSIADLVAYRQRADSIVERVFERTVPTVYGADFRMVIYRNQIDGAEHVAMVRGQPDPATPVLVRSHAVDLAADLFGYDNGRRDYIERAMRALAASDLPGVAIFLRNPSITWASHYAGAEGSEPEDEPLLSDREYGIGAQILRDLGVRRMILLTDNPPKADALAVYGLAVEEVRSF